MSSELSQPRSNALPAEPPEDEFSLVLLRVIQSMREDPAILRNAVYELAKIQLQREAWRQNPPMDILETRRLSRALETAIERVEFIARQEDELRRLLGPVRAVWTPLLETQHVAETWPPEPHARERSASTQEPIVVIDHPSPNLPASFPDLTEFGKELPRLMSRRQSLFMPKPLLRFAALIVLSAGVIAGVRGYVGLPHVSPAAPETRIEPSLPPTTPSVTAAPVNGPAVPAAVGTSDFPLPSVFGIYALSAGQLHELETLPGRVPDPRVFMSTPITNPSRTVLADGRVYFVLYRRNLANDPPERVTVRVVAQVARAMSFDGAGRARTVSVGDTWTIRGNAYEMTVAPVSTNPEMLIVRPKDSDLALPAGRYVLVIKGEGYDFSVAGDVTDPAHCLERIQAANGEFYSECRRRRP